MKPPLVLILSHLFEPSVDEVVSRLTTRGVKWHRLNVEEFPLLIESAFSLGDLVDEGCVLNLVSGQVVPSDVTAVWFRRATKPALPVSLSERDRVFAQNEAAAFLNGVLDGFDAHWINDRDAERKVSNKINQLRIAKKIGFGIPDTLITNSKDYVRPFLKSHRRVLFKPVSGYSPYATDFTGPAQERFSKFGRVRVTPRDNEEGDLVFAQILTEEKFSSLDSLYLSPVIFQEFVEKASDVRVTVVGSKVFSCKIHSQDNATTSVDFRRLALLPEGKKVKHEAIRIDDEIKEKVLEFMELSGLSFGCFDFVERLDGKLTFLEVNPSGQWLWVERLTGLPIADAVADLLTKAA